MTKSGILAAAAIVASVLASPAMAQSVTYNSPGYCAPNTICGPGDRHAGYQRRTAYRHNGQWDDSYNRYDRDSGFWPADVAAGVVGGAVGTAAAIATAPFGGNEYARRNGFVCTPGTVFRGDDGRRHLCQ